MLVNNNEKIDVRICFYPARCEYLIVNEIGLSDFQHTLKIFYLLVQCDYQIYHKKIETHIDGLEYTKLILC